MTTVTTTDPRNGRSRSLDIQESSTEDVRRIVTAAIGAGRELQTHPRSWRAGLLRVIADELDASRGDLTGAAEAETGLSAARLDGEVTRTVFQFRLFADAVDEGSYLEAAIDHAADTPAGAGPDVRRMLMPIGPVAVFGASNFPFAFSVPGGDTASALAAGNPVVAKAHPAHPMTSMRAFDALRRALDHHGAPREAVGIVFGMEAGASLVSEPGIRAVAFTGSARTGRILMDLAAARPMPIPFYGELSSINPVIVSPAAAAARGEQIAEGLFASVTGSAGQLCTKPGLAFIPRGADALVDALVARAREAEEHPMLSAGIRSAFEESLAELGRSPGVRPLVEGRRSPAAGTAVVPAVLEVDVQDVTAAVGREAFGPAIVLVRYDDVGEVVVALRALSGSLTATVHVEPSDDLDLTELLPDLQSLAGRVVFNGYPTGVRVSWAQHHGGPWPATNSIHTSVGVTAMRRFLRPMAWQSAPQHLLPVELRDGTADLPRRIDGVLTLPPPSSGGDSRGR